LWGSVRGVPGNRHPYRDGWSQRGAHLLLQIRTRVLDEEWERTFRSWYPAFRPKIEAEVKNAA